MAEQIIYGGHGTELCIHQALCDSMKREMCGLRTDQSAD